MAGHVCDEGFAGIQVVLLCGKEGSERAVNLSGGFVNDGGGDTADGSAEGGEEAVGFHGISSHFSMSSVYAIGCPLS